MDSQTASAWEPVTPRGVAAFARARPGRLWLTQFFVAALAAVCVVWLLHDGFFPTVTAAVEKLADAGEIRGAKLDWRGEPKVLLAESRFIAFTVDLEQSGAIRSPAHVQVQFGRNSARVFSLLGYADFSYPPGWIIAFNRPELLPKWGAWQPPLLALTALGVVFCLLLTWALLAALYAGPVWLLGLYLNRDLTLRGSWKLSGAALMPGALLMAAAFLLYDFGAFDLVTLAFVMGGHFLLGWIYLVASTLFLPRHPTVAVEKKNPFAPGA